MDANSTLQPYGPRENYVNVDPKIDPKKERLAPTKDLKEVWIRSQDFQTPKLGTSLTKVEEEKLIVLFIKKIVLFAWDPSKM